MNRLTVADWLTGLATVLATVAAAAGLFVPNVYRDVAFWSQQARGTDVATLFVAVPMLASGLWTARHGSIIGRLVVVAGLLYLTYNYAIFAFSVAMNPLLVVYIAALALAVWSFALWLTSSGPPRPAAVRLPQRLTAGVLITISILFGLLWLGQIAQATIGGTVPVDLARAEIPTNPIYALDLGLFLPLGIVAARGLLARTPAGGFALPMLIWLFLTSVGIVAAFVFAAVDGETLAVGPALFVGAIGLVTGGLALVAILRHSSVNSSQ